MDKPPPPAQPPLAYAYEYSEGPRSLVSLLAVFAIALGLLGLVFDVTYIWSYTFASSAPSPLRADPFVRARIISTPLCDLPVAALLTVVGFTALLRSRATWNCALAYLVASLLPHAVSFVFALAQSTNWRITVAPGVTALLQYLFSASISLSRTLLPAAGLLLLTRPGVKSSFQLLVTGVPA